MLIYGHRGASASEPENTLLAFETAIKAGAAGLEFDVQATADGVPIILHDRDLARTTNGAGAVDLLSLEELRKLDAGKGEHIPTLNETLSLVGDRVHLDIEIKQAAIEEPILSVLALHPRARWSISSFDWSVLATIRALKPDADIWLLAVNVSDALFTAASDIGVSAVSLYHKALSADNAGRLRAAGLETVVWTVNEVDEARRCRNLGAMGLCTDDPGGIIAGLAAS